MDKKQNHNHALIIQLMKHQLLGNNFQSFFHIICRCILIGTAVTQLYILDYYIKIYGDFEWKIYIWIGFDVFIIIMFIITLILSYCFLKGRKTIISPVQNICTFIGQLPMSWLTWMFYSFLISTKMWAIFCLPDSIALKLDEKNFFGPNMLKTGLSLSSIVLYLLVMTSHDCKSGSERMQFIMSLVGSAYLDILDTTQFTGIFKEEELVISKFHLDKIALGIVVFNFVLPTVPLFFLSRSSYGIHPFSRRHQLLYKIIYFLVTNLPIFLVRMIVWHTRDMNVSVFIVKNLIAVGFAIKEIHEFWLEITEAIIGSNASCGAKSERGINLDDWRERELFVDGGGDVEAVHIAIDTIDGNRNSNEIDEEKI